jgi:flagellar basal body-associated protein FliL
MTAARMAGPVVLWAVLLGACGLLVACAGRLPDPGAEAECPLYSELGQVRANPAGALDRHLAVELSFRVCPPAALPELQRRRIELKHEVLSLLSVKDAAQLTDPLRVEKLQREVLEMVNARLMRKGRVTAVYVTAFELQ